jgi:hypothetical protein
MASVIGGGFSTRPNLDRKAWRPRIALNPRPVGAMHIKRIGQQASAGQRIWRRPQFDCRMVAAASATWVSRFARRSVESAKTAATISGGEV